MKTQIEWIPVERELAHRILDELYELRGERSWWIDEPRCNYQTRYEELVTVISALEKQLEEEQ